MKLYQLSGNAGAFIDTLNKLESDKKGSLETAYGYTV